MMAYLDPYSVLTAIPAVLTTLQNYYLFFAMDNLTPAVYHVVGKGKLVLTAVVFFAVAGRNLSGSKWLSLLSLALGVILVGWNAYTDVSKGNSGGGSLFLENNSALGLKYLMTSWLFSIVADVVSDQFLQQPMSPFVRRSQLAFFGVLSSVVIMIYTDFHQIRARGMFAGYSSVVYFVVIWHALGNVISSYVTKYLDNDNVMKGVTTLIAILFSTAISVAFFGFVVTPAFVFGATLVSAAMFMY
jgi:UDP-sugar transporter A1/2/3